MRCRVFKIRRGWTLLIFFFNENISYKEIKSNKNTDFLTKQHYCGKHDFSVKFLENFDKEEIGDKEYYILYHTSEK